MMEEEVHNTQHKKKILKTTEKQEKQKEKGRRETLPIALLLGFSSFFFLLRSLFSYFLTGEAIIPCFSFSDKTNTPFVNFSNKLSMLLLVFSRLFSFLPFPLLFFWTFTAKRISRKTTCFFPLLFSCFGLQIITIIAWIGMFEYVSALEVNDNPGDLEIAIRLPNGEQLSGDTIVPKETENLVAPVDIDFLQNILSKPSNGKGVLFKKLSGIQQGTAHFFSTQDTIQTFRITKTGTRTVLFRIVFEDGETIEKSISFVIPQGSFQAKPENGSIPLEVEFDATLISQDIDGVEYYEWDFDDKTEQQETQGPKVLHTFEQIGNYNITLHILIVIIESTFSKTISTTKNQIILSEHLSKPFLEFLKQMPPLPLEVKSNFQEKNRKAVKEILFNIRGRFLIHQNLFALLLQKIL